MQYTFVNDFNTKPEEKITTFYQICSFPNPKTSKYDIRKFLISDNNEFVDIKLYSVDKKKYKQFINSHKNFKYKSYSAYDISIVAYPTLSDILQSKSNILATNYQYYGNAPF